MRVSLATYSLKVGARRKVGASKRWATQFVRNSLTPVRATSSDVFNLNRYLPNAMLVVDSLPRAISCPKGGGSGFRFIHATAIHLDSPLRGLSKYGNAPAEQLRNATRESLKELVTRATDDEVSFVVFAGDLYDSDWRDYHAGIFFRRSDGATPQSANPHVRASQEPRRRGRDDQEADPAR